MNPPRTIPANMEGVPNKFCPFLPWVIVRNPLAVNDKAPATETPMRCQGPSCAIYDEAMKMCGIRHSVSVNMAHKEVKIL